MREPDLNKGYFGTMASLRLLAQIRKSSNRKRTSMTAVVLDALELQFGRIHLCKEDHDWIVAQKKKNIAKREYNRKDKRCENKSEKND